MVTRRYLEGLFFVAWHISNCGQFYIPPIVECPDKFLVQKCNLKYCI